MPVPIRTYVGVSRVYHVGAAVTDMATEEFAWPPTNLNGDQQLLFKNIANVPQSDDWGLDTVNATTNCNGLSFAPGDITLDNAPKVNQVTNITVNVHNNSIDGTSGTPIAANGVVATFLHAPFGGGGFGPFVPAGNPSSATTIPASSTTPITVAWTPTAASPHECILCRLSSTSNGTTIINAGEFINSAVAAMSTATLLPILSMKGVSAPVGGGKQKVKISSQKQYQYAYADGSLAEIPKLTLTAQLSWVFLISHETGLDITIKGKKMPIVEPLNGYTSTFQHAMTPDFQKTFEAKYQRQLLRCELSSGSKYSIACANRILAGLAEKPDPSLFQTNIKGPTAVPNGNGVLYTVDIPQNGEITVPTTVSYGAGGGGGGKCSTCLCCFQTKTSTPAAGASVGLILLVGLFAYRRRR
jgi:MYXO-CTERM domain-containing protein